MVYELTFDENGLLDFTQKNIDLIETCISIDSRYRRAFDVTNEEGSAWFIKNNLDFNNEHTIELLCKLIDAENSTHLSVSGTKTGSENNRGIDEMVKRISGIPDVEDRIKEGDLLLVDYLAQASDRIYKLSFASKFCTYVARYRFGSDKFSIYDKVVQRTIPYYAWNYLGERYIGRKNSSISIERGFSNSPKNTIRCYVDYSNLIERIIEQINCKRKLKIGRKDFDHMLWYYYKGDESLINRAIDFVVKRESPLFF